VKNKNKLRIGVNKDKSLAIHLAINSMKYGEKSIFRVRKEYIKTLTEYQLNQEDVRVFKIITEN